ncbi:hypothetical protein QYF36_024745 [Acer negundo]|nr:hypothetical protein QYF36_024745 [Acer negundo]
MDTALGHGCSVSLLYKHKFQMVMKCSTTLNTLLEEYNAIGIQFGFSYDSSHLNDVDLGKIVKKQVLELDGRLRRVFSYKEGRLFTIVVDE